uniref:Orc1 n=1 Tax=Arundo donax TaxID=35708 RepID=A0A0A9AKF3_ARUDO
MYHLTFAQNVPSGSLHKLSMRAAHKSLERSFSLAVLTIRFPSGGLGRSTAFPARSASQYGHAQSPSGTRRRGGRTHRRWNPPRHTSHSTITPPRARKHTRHSSSGSSASDSAPSRRLTYTSSPTSNSPPSYTTFR